MRRSARAVRALLAAAPSLAVAQGVVAQGVVAQVRPAVAPLHARATLTPVSVTGARVTMLLTLTIDPGWHVSWRNPGDTGLPTRLGVSLPAGMRLVREVWPVPVVARTPVGTQHTLEGEVPWLLELASVGAPSADRLIGVTLRYGVCREVCIPEQQSVQGALPSSSAEGTPIGTALLSRLASDAGPLPARLTGGMLCVRLPARVTAESPLELVADSGSGVSAALRLARRGSVATARLSAGSRLRQGTAVLLVHGASGHAATLDLQAPATGCGGRRDRR